MFKLSFWVPSCLTALCISQSANAISPLSVAFQKEHVPTQLIVKFKQGIRATEEKKVFEQIGAKVLSRFKFNNAVLLHLPRYIGPQALEKIATWIAKLPNVEYVEPNHVVHAYDFVPNDPMFEALYGMENTGANNGVADADIDAAKAWERTTGSKNVLVGIIDTGIDYNHPDLAANIWNNPGETGLDANGKDKRTNGIDDDNNGYIDDWRGWDFANNDNDPFDDNKHGTHCAGTIGGVGNNGVGVAGVSWNVSLVGLKFLKKDGSGSTADAVKAVEYANSIGVNILSNSWGGAPSSETLLAAIQKANEKNILFVAAAGNNYSDNDINPQYPASYKVDNILAVAATNNQDQMAAFSNFGKNSVHLAAPGVDIISTIPNAHYEALSGTSMATPHVAGAAALLKAAYPEFGAKQLKDRLLLSVDVVPGLSGKTITGGRLNIASALEEDTTPPSAPSELKVEVTGGQSVAFSWKESGDDNTEGLASRYEVRTSKSPLASIADWNNANVATLSRMSKLPGERISALIDDLPAQTQGYLAIKAFDNVGNVSAISESLTFATKNLIRTYTNTADSMDGLIATGYWGLDNQDGRTVFSTSPGRRYPENLKETLQFPPFAFADSSFLELKTKYDMERNFDFASIEVSWDGGQNWTEVKRITGATYQWQVQRVDLSGTVPAGTSEILLRLKFTSDHSVTGAGWFVDELSLYRAE